MMPGGTPIDPEISKSDQKSSEIQRLMVISVDIQQLIHVFKNPSLMMKSCDIPHDSQDIPDFSKEGQELKLARDREDSLQNGG